MADLMQVNPESEFAKEVYKIFENNTIKVAIETGTYLGIGTTKIVLDAMKVYNQDTDFYSIEANKWHQNQARENLKNLGYENKVKLVYGLSIPSVMALSKEEIDEWVKKYENEDIYIDHNPDVRTQLYLDEAPTNIEDAVLGKCLLATHPDLLILDSAGHLGWVEFKYALNLMEKECFIVLDDIFHLKHFESYKYIQAHPESFDLITVSHEKFGFLVAKWKGSVEIAPEPIVTPPVKKLKGKKK